MAATRTEPIAERRLVSVLFADLVGFTPFAEGRDAEDVRETLSRYFELARDVIERYGGTVEKFIGDAVMAVWGAPVAREDDAERAVRAALELVDVVRTLGPEIQARCGVLTGEVAVTIGARNEGMVAGDMVNTASRLQSAAPPGTVLVGEPTQRAASGAIVFEAAGEQVLKGKVAPVAAWRAVRVVSERGGRNRSESLEAPFVGRDEELRQVKDLFHATEREGKARLISVMGPAGIGKTRLGWEFLKYADGLAGTVYWHTGRSLAYGDGVTFWALGEMIRERAGLLESADVATTRERIAGVVEQHVPDAGEQGWIQAALLALLGQQAEISSDQLFAAWRTFFERLAATAPVVMVFEDLHHADSGLLDFIEHLMEWTRSAPILVITLARPELLDRRPSWGAGVRSFVSIPLDPLGDDEMELLLDGLVPGLPSESVGAIVARAEGIPLYAIETVRMLLAQDQLVLDGDVYRPTTEPVEISVPETLTALIAARLDRLDATDRSLMEDAAVLGQSFTPVALAAVSGVDAMTLVPRLRDLVRRELLVVDVDPRSPERGQYTFVQALVREVAYKTLSKKDRKIRHLAAARFFESLETDELAGGLASHYLAAQQLAADEGEADALAAQARVALRGAAERAASLGAHDQALLFLDQAFQVTSDAAERIELAKRALASAEKGLDPDLVEQKALELVEASRALADRSAIAYAVAEHGRVIAGWHNQPERALTVLQLGWDEYSDLEQSPEGVALMQALARAHSAARNDEEALRWADRLLPIAERLNLLERITDGLLTRGSVLVRMNRARESLVLVRGSYQLALSGALEDETARARVPLTFYEQWNEPATGLALARDGLEAAIRRGSRVAGFLMVGNGVICALRVGEWQWAAELLDEWAETDVGLSAFAELFFDRAILTALRGRDPADDIATAAEMRGDITDTQFTSYEHWARAWASFADGEYTSTGRLATNAWQTTGYFWPLAAPLGARAALWAGDAVGARHVLDGLDASGYHGTALELDRITLRAGVACLEGRGPEALNGYREALRGWRGLGLAFDEALAATDMSMLLPAPQRDSPEVTEAADRAQATLQRLGASPILSRLDSHSSPSAEPIGLSAG